jgi:hypothetical protein
MFGEIDRGVAAQVLWQDNNPSHAMIFQLQSVISSGYCKEAMGLSSQMWPMEGRSRQQDNNTSCTDGLRSESCMEGLHPSQALRTVVTSTTH